MLVWSRLNVVKEALLYSETNTFNFEDSGLEFVMGVNFLVESILCWLSCENLLGYMEINSVLSFGQ